MLSKIGGGNMHQQKDISSLTGLRAIAALSIVLGHYFGSAQYRVLGVQWEFTIIGIPLFFTLSGFIIHYVYVRLFDGEWASAACEFIVARFARLYPLFFFLLLYYLYWPSLIGQLHGNRVVLLSTVTLTASWWYTTIDKVAPTQMLYGWSWTISTECFFYLMYMLFLYRVGRIRNAALCVTLLIGLCVVSYALLYGVYFTQDIWENYAIALHPEFISRSDNFINSFYFWFIYISPYLHVMEFLGGCLLAQFYLLVRDREQPLGAVVPHVLAWGGTCWIAGALIFISLEDSVPAIVAATPDAVRTALGFFRFVDKNFLLAPGCYMLILACAVGGNSVSSALSAPLSLFLGECSYSLYLAHPLVRSFAGVNPGQDHMTLRLCVAVMMAVCVAAGLYAALEVPSRRWIRRGYEWMIALISSERVIA